jgi:hypothetical protein
VGTRRNLCASDILLTHSTWHYKQQCYIWDTWRGKGILSSRVITAFIRADLRGISLFCYRQVCWLTTYRHQKFELYILHFVPCVFTVLGCVTLWIHIGCVTLWIHIGCVILWIHMFIDMIWRKLWRKCVGYLLCQSLYGCISVAGKPPYNHHVLKILVFQNIFENW